MLFFPRIQRLVLNERNVSICSDFQLYYLQIKMDYLSIIYASTIKIFTATREQSVYWNLSARVTVVTSTPENQGKTHKIVYKDYIEHQGDEKLTTH